MINQIKLQKKHHLPVPAEFEVQCVQLVMQLVTQ